VTVRANANDRVQRAVVGWRASCDHASHLRGGTVFGSRLRKSKPGFFADHGSYRDKGRDGGQHFKAVYRVAISGRMRSEQRWAGSFHARIVFRYEDGGVIRCSAPSVSWAATN
jgi:hypothetical protein